MNGATPEPGVRAAMVLHELYADLEPSRMANAYRMVKGPAEGRANALIQRWLTEAYNQGQEDSEYAHQKAQERDAQEFMDQARQVSRGLETVVPVAQWIQDLLNKGGRADDHPGGRVPAWCGPLCTGRCTTQTGGVCDGVAGQGPAQGRP